MNALPHLMDAVKVAFPLALVGTVVGEFIGGNRGIGYLILSGQFNLDSALVFACLLSLTLFTTADTGAVALAGEALSRLATFASTLARLPKKLSSFGCFPRPRL